MTQYLVLIQKPPKQDSVWVGISLLMAAEDITRRFACSLLSIWIQVTVSCPHNAVLSNLACLVRTEPARIGVALRLECCIRRHGQHSLVPFLQKLQRVTTTDLVVFDMIEVQVPQFSSYTFNLWKAQKDCQ